MVHTREYHDSFDDTFGRASIVPARDQYCEADSDRRRFLAEVGQNLRRAGGGTGAGRLRRPCWSPWGRRSSGSRGASAGARSPVGAPRARPRWRRARRADAPLGSDSEGPCAAADVQHELARCQAREADLLLAEGSLLSQRRHPDQEVVTEGPVDDTPGRARRRIRVQERSQLVWGT